jgi:hypothetical protein
MKEINALFSKGNILKVILESLNLSVTRINLVIDEKGIMIREGDDGGTIMTDVWFPRENLKEYVCTKKRILNVCVKQFFKQLRNVKKKDYVTLFIDPENYASDQLAILIQPEENKTDSYRSELNFITFTEDIEYNLMDIPSSDDYNYPVTIEACEFQKIKKMISSSRRMQIDMNKSSYISFQPSDSELLKSKIFFGKPPEGKCEYSTEFNSSNVNMIIKFPGMCSTMQFYSPKDTSLPIKIKVEAVQNNCIMGTVIVYINSCMNIISTHNIEEVDSGVKFRREKKNKK